MEKALVARFISAFNQRDLDGMLATLGRDIEFHPLRGEGIAHSYTGHAGVTEWFAHLSGVGHDYCIVVSAIESPRPDAVLVAGQLELGDEPLAIPFCATYRLSDGLIADAHHYMSDRATLESLGITSA